MAYVSAQMTKAVRRALRVKFADMKFSVRKNAHSSTLYITILSSKVDLTDDLQGDKYNEINHYHVEHYNHSKLYKEILAEMMKATASAGSAYFDDSDSQTDYFHCAYYYSLSVGDYENHYKVVA